LIHRATIAMALNIKKAGLSDKIPIDMTPMIDIVFQLLTFFCMTLKVASAEGDFNIKMPLAAQSAGLPDPNQLPPMKVRMRADGGGNLAELSLNDRSFTGADRFKALHQYIASLVGEGSLAASAEVELDCDFNLKYEFVIEAITAVSGTLAPDGQIVKLVEKIKFSPPREGE
jgi:biopolymer transport protein ExbD